MGKIILIASVLLSGCAAPYVQTSAFPPTPDVKVAKRACIHSMMAQTADIPLGLVGGLAAIPERDAIFDECMRAHGYAQLQ
jgi:hypothetical protein